MYLVYKIFPSSCPKCNNSFGSQNNFGIFYGEGNSLLERIANHYDSVVPPMKENADRSNLLGRVVESKEAIIESEEMRVNGQHN